jgi:fucose permease
VAGILAGLGIFMYFAPLPEVKAEGEDETDQEASSSITGNKTSIMQFPHLLLGVATLFIYVGVETLPMASMLDFAKSVFPDADLTGYSKYVPIGLMIGYIFGVLLIPKIISQTTALKIVTIIGIGASLALIFLPGNLGIYCLAAIGFANSLMWPAIWPLAIADLGKFTKTGASLLVMGIVGGAVIPLIFGVLVDTFKGANELVTTANFQSAYWIFIPGYLFILYFAIWGHKIRK